MSANPPIFRPNLPLNERDEINEELITLMNHCWAEQPNERPGFDDILKTLRNINKGKYVKLFFNQAFNGWL